MRYPPSPPPPTPVLPVVLLAEDDDELRRLLARRLRRAGYDVIEARTGVQLLELVLEHSVEPLTPPLRPAALVISDVRMPGRSGLDVLRVLRRASVDTPVILITAFGSADVHIDAAALGARVYDKPVDLDRLAAEAERLAPLPAHAD